ncbi:hypothetical protein Kpol_262p7 [Vanderwaltozyma polyspora DSM 70294]|uniref:Superoxide dismutase 1 copper chaperone n=1 Tax=Vanderwaltozyma polyspora (strain ATCC 22028 / DSM 70294 / BCRC 21397 / CBS 2163 / NBRC 10782 / NRRL Y-8283 / UCD 57-17) TaxID=436907 RepID=A7TT11_VANPO|nr:uncharacterized protein Kpol_262p7 [Vanderwaltozyma polyspora DSM 70294]EDO14602.1 hypothetical protein Kpol_262p7 [Vanderwaltozyma polyspora DSM 70294]
MTVGKDEVFEATYAVAMHCQGCANDIKSTLDKLPEDKEINFDIENQIMSIKSNIPPSTIIETLQKECKKDAIIRGAGGSNSSAVCILETAEGDSDNVNTNNTRVRGLVRMVEVNDGKKTLFDVTLNGVRYPGQYTMTVNENGDISKGFKTVGGMMHKFNQMLTCNDASDISKVDKLYSGKSFFSEDDIPIWKLIGRSITMKSNTNPEYGVLGVIARSAGVWENDKQVCACSGKTVWQERQDAHEHNIHF